MADENPTRDPLKQLTAKEQRLIDTSIKIATEPLNNGDMAFAHAILCQVGMPRSKVDGNEFIRQCGGAVLKITGGDLWNGKDLIAQPIPYGSMPRLVMAYLNTYALRLGSPEVPVGDSASEFLRMLGKSTDGGKRGAFTTFRKQTQALAACRMVLGFNANGRAYTYNGQPVQEFQAWLSHKDEQRSLWPGVVRLSDEYFRTLKDHAVPLDMRALADLKGSSLALDVYYWLAQRLYRIEGRPVVLHWKALKEQFGQEYTGANAEKDFKTTFTTAFNQVLLAYPTAKAKRVTGGLLLAASPPPVSPRGQLS
jgi:hypothetical protein